MQIKAILFTAVICYIFLLRKDIRQKSLPFSPVRLTLLPWILVLFLQILPLMEPGYHTLGWKPVAFVLGANIIFILPKLLWEAPHHSPRRIPNPTNIINLDFLLVFLSFCAIIGVMLEISGKLSVYSIDFFSLSRSARLQIEQLWLLEFHRPTYMKVGLLLSALWGPLLFVGLLVAERLSRINQLLLVAMSLSGVLLSIADIGRVHILCMLIIYLTAGLIRKTYGYPFLPRIRSIRITIVLILTTTIDTGRISTPMTSSA